MLSIEFYLFPSRCFHSDLVGCGCLFRAFAVLCRWRISLLGSWKMEHGCKRYIQTTFKTTETIGQHESTMVHIYIYIYIYRCVKVLSQKWVCMLWLKCVPGMQQASELVTALNDFARGDEQIILADVNFGKIWHVRLKTRNGEVVFYIWVSKEL